MKDRGKTGVESLIPLLPIPLEILAKYEGKTKNGKLLPVISNQKMNEYLAENCSYLSDKQADNLPILRDIRSRPKFALPKVCPLKAYQKCLAIPISRPRKSMPVLWTGKLSHDMNVLERKLRTAQNGSSQKAS